MVLPKAYQHETVGPLKVGLARTGIGIVAGISYAALWVWLGSALVPSFESVLLYYLLLLPIRRGEWFLVLWLFFDRALQQKLRLRKCSAYGTGRSYLLDVPALATALVLPGGFWIC